MPALKRLLYAIVLCSFASAAQANNGLQKIKEKAVLRIGVEPGFLPFEMRTPQDQWVGFDVDMMRAFCTKIAVKCEFISSKWDGIIPGLVAGKYDVIASGMTITPERAKMVLFSDPYFDAGTRIMLPIKSTITSLADLDQAKHTVVVKLGTTGDIFASKTLKKAQIRRMDSEADAAQSVALGRADAFIYDKPYIDIFVMTRKEKVKALPEVLSTEQFGLASTKKNQTLVDAFNVFLKEWKASGAYAKAYKDHFEDLVWKKQFPQNF